MAATHANANQSLEEDGSNSLMKGGKQSARRPEALEHIRNRFAGPLASLLESEALRRGLINQDIPTLYESLRLYHNEIFARISRDVEPMALSSALSDIVFDSVGQTVSNGDPEVIASALCDQLDPHSLFYCTIDSSFLGMQLNYLRKRYGLGGRFAAMGGGRTMDHHNQHHHQHNQGHPLGSFQGNQRFGGQPQQQHNNHRGGGQGYHSSGLEARGSSLGGKNTNNNFPRTHVHNAQHPSNSLSPAGAFHHHDNSLNIPNTCGGGALMMAPPNASSPRMPMDPHASVSFTQTGRGGGRSGGFNQPHHEFALDSQNEMERGEDGGGSQSQTSGDDRRQTMHPNPNNNNYAAHHACVDFMHGKCARGDACRFSHSHEAQSANQRSNHYNAIISNGGGHNKNNNNNNNFNSHHDAHAASSSSSNQQNQNYYNNNNNNNMTGTSTCSSIDPSLTPNQHFHHHHHHPPSASSRGVGGTSCNGQQQQKENLLGASTASNSTSAASLLNAPPPAAVVGPTPTITASSSSSAAVPPPPPSSALVPPPPPPEMLINRRGVAPPPPPPEALQSLPSTYYLQQQQLQQGNNNGARTPTPSSPSTASSPVNPHTPLQRSEGGTTVTLNNPYQIPRTSPALPPSAYAASAASTTEKTECDAAVGHGLGPQSDDGDTPLALFLQANGQAHLVDPLRNGGFTYLHQLKSLSLSEFEQRLKVRICSRSIRSGLWDALHPDQKGLLSAPSTTTTTRASLMEAPVAPAAAGSSFAGVSTATAGLHRSRGAVGGGGDLPANATKNILKAFLASNDIKSGGGEQQQHQTDVPITNSPSKAIVAAHTLNALLHVPVAVTRSAEPLSAEPSPHPITTHLVQNHNNDNNNVNNSSAGLRPSSTTTAPSASTNIGIPSAVNGGGGVSMQQDVRAIIWLRSSLSTPLEEIKSAVSLIGRFFDCGIADYKDGNSQWTYFKLASYEKELQTAKIIHTQRGGKLVIVDRTLFTAGHKDDGLTPELPEEARRRLLRSNGEDHSLAAANSDPTSPHQSQSTPSSPSAAKRASAPSRIVERDSRTTTVGAGTTTNHDENNALAKTSRTMRGGPAMMGARVNTHPSASDRSTMRGGNASRGDRPSNRSSQGGGGGGEEGAEKEKDRKPAVCRFFIRRSCTKGDACPYRHEMPRAQ